VKVAVLVGDRVWVGVAVGRAVAVRVRVLLGAGAGVSEGGSAAVVAAARAAEEGVALGEVLLPVELRLPSQYPPRASAATMIPA